MKAYAPHFTLAEGRFKYPVDDATVEVACRKAESHSRKAKVLVQA